jgi:hypothetical protein
MEDREKKNNVEDEKDRNKRRRQERSRTRKGATEEYNK